MKKAAACILLVLAAGCASSSRQNDDDTTMSREALAAHAQESANQESIRQLQTSLTELLDRIDVLNDRIARLEAGTAVAAQPAPREQAAQAPAASAAQPAPVQAAPAVREPGVSRAVAGAQMANTYRQALMLFGQGKMPEARRVFQQVYDAEPTGDLADNALFWIGETYFAGGEYADAMKYYRRVTTEFSEQNKAPDAMFKIALSFEKTSDLGMARTTLEELIRRYPYATAAASAKLELKRIRY